MATTMENKQGLSAEIVTTGTEILMGEIVDTNAAWIAQQLRDIGVNLYFKTTVGDNEGRVRGVIELGLSRSNVIIVSGGLGPTADDITRQAIAAATRCPLELHPDALAALEARFARFGTKMTDNNKQQALIPRSAAIIENPVGTAPGFIVETAQGTVIALPGVPREMKHLMTETVLPYLRERNSGQGVISRRVLRTIGIGESMIDNRLAELMHGANPTVGLSAHTAQADVRIAARAATKQAADALLDGLEQEIRSRIGDHIYSSTSGEPFECVVVSKLQERDNVVALLETNTAGVVAHRLATGLATYNPVKATWNIANEPLPPELLAQVATPAERFTEDQVVDCARWVQRTAGSDFGIAIVGTSGVEEGIYGRTSGRTWIALAMPNGDALPLFCPYGGVDEFTITRLGNQALFLLWQQLKV
jgi:nicotinamide-nucleotide amidase